MKAISKLLGLASVLTIGLCNLFPATADDHLNIFESNSEPVEEFDLNNPITGNIIEVATKRPSFNVLVKLVKAADLEETLSATDANYTLFAPTDEAFKELPNGTLEYLLQPENKEVLQRVLSYHVIPQSLMANQMTDGSLEALGGGLSVGVNGTFVVVNNASVIAEDIEADNGVIHAVNRVLLPSDLQAALSSELGIEESEIY